MGALFLAEGVLLAEAVNICTCALGKQVSEYLISEVFSLQKP